MSEPPVKVKLEINLTPEGYSASFVRDEKTEFSWQVEFQQSHDILSLEQELASRFDHMLEIFGLFK